MHKTHGHAHTFALHKHALGYPQTGIPLATATAIADTPTARCSACAALLMGPGPPRPTGWHAEFSRPEQSWQIGMIIRWHQDTVGAPAPGLSILTGAP